MEVLKLTDLHPAAVRKPPVTSKDFLVQSQVWCLRPLIPKVRSKPSLHSRFQDSRIKKKKNLL